MNRFRKYILIFLGLIVFGWVLSIMAENTRHNIEMVVLNKSDQPLVKIKLKTDKTNKSLLFNGIEVGTQLIIRFHLEAEDTGQLFLEQADGKKWQTDPIPIAPGNHIVHRVTREGIATHRENAKSS